MLTKRRKGIKVEELDDAAIRARIAAATAEIRQIDALPPKEVRGRERETLAKYKRAVEVVELGEAELRSREHELMAANAPARRRLQDEADARRARHEALAPVVGALEFVRRRAHPELRGTTLAANRLSESEGQELSDLVRKQKAILFREDAPPLTDAEERRYQALCGKVAGEEGIFERKRQEAEAKGKLAGLKDKRHIGSLPRRPRLEEPGSVTLPRLVFRWLMSDREGAWTVAEVGALAVILACFENRDGSLINARFEERNGEPMLLATGGVGSELRFRGAIGGDSFDFSSSGFVRLRPALATLVRNQWLGVEVGVAETVITLGPRAKALGRAG